MDNELFKNNVVFTLPTSDESSFEIVGDVNITGNVTIVTDKFIVAPKPQE